MKPKETLLSDNPEVMSKLLNDQKQITEVYQELTYDELSEVLAKWIAPDANADDEEISTAATVLSPKAEVKVPEVKVDEMAAAKKVDAVSTAFDSLFNS
jgi:hypothetical protein